MVNPHTIILVDTDVASYVIKGDARVSVFFPFFINSTLAISFITVGELYFWAEKRAWGSQRIDKLEKKINEYLILPYDRAVCRQYAIVRHQCEKSGLPINLHDYWVAACAIRFNCALATNNTQHYKNIKGLELIAPG